MKTNSFPAAARVLLVTPCLIVSLFLFVLAFSNLSASYLARALSDKKSPDLAVPIPFSGTYAPTVFPCATPRHHFIVPPGQVRLIVQVQATIVTNDLTLSLLFGPDPSPALIHTEDTGTSGEVYVYSPPGGVPAGEYQVQICETPNPGGIPQVAPYDYNGTFTMDNTAPGGGSPPPVTTNVPPALLDTGPKIGFENFAAPGVLVPVTTTSAGAQAHSVEYMGRGAGEPSIGNNWLSDTTIFYSDLQSLFVKFNDTCPGSGLSSTWANRPAPTAQAVDSDPIGFTDSVLGRSFSGQLTLLSPTCKTSYTTDDGQTWVPTQGSGIASGVDHETIGGGKYAPPFDTNPPDPTYPHAVYYCSQEGVPNSGPPSFCSRSDNGGLTFGPSIPLTNPPINVCGGLHGHVKVSPVDGTVYVPFNMCDGVGSVVVSTDNGITWNVRHVQNGTVSMAPSASFQDPAVAIDANGRVYFVIANNDTAAAVLTSDNHGQTWQNLGDVAAVYALHNIRYPAAVAGDAGRAAVAFYGTTTPGDALQPNFVGVWHLYVANTFDGGIHWTTTDATPNAPMQRGCIWAKGGANICRNLLDFFDMTVDRDGRVQVGYVNGCEGGNCVQAPLTPSGQTPPGQGNAYTTAATIARQSSGRRLFAANDPGNPVSKPGMPLLTERRVGNVVNLQWSEADTGNSPITGYQIMRGTASGAETLHASVPGTQIGGSYTDALPANDVTTYYYKVLALNSAGPSCGNNEVVAPFIGTTCSGIIIHRNDPTHPEANGGMATPPSLLIDYIAVAEPENSTNFLFKMKVNDLSTLPPNSRWRMVWDSFSSPGQQFYVGMRTDATSTASFQYGTLADAGVPAVFVISEQDATPALAGSNFQPDGTITVLVPKSAFGNPQPGALLGAVNGRTFTGDTPQTQTLHRSNLFIDHTFVKAQTDNGYPAATYLVAGNNPCAPGGITAVGAVSRKTHGSAGDWDIDLPLTGTAGIECRKGQGTNSNGHKMVITFATAVSITGNPQASVTSGSGQVSSVTVNGSVVTVGLTNVANAQTLTVTLFGVTDGTNSGNVSIPMSVLLGDTNANASVNSSDVAQTKGQIGTSVGASNFREDVTVNGEINSSDVSVIKAQTGTALP
jgi:hypothetical protein